MEVVCLILGPTLTSQPLFACFLGFDVPTSSFIFIENVFIILVIIISGQTTDYIIQKV